MNHSLHRHGQVATFFLLLILMLSSVSAYNIYYDAEALPSDYENEIVYYHFGDLSDVEGVSGGAIGSYLDYADSDLAANNLIDPVNPRATIIPGKWGNAVGVPTSFLTDSPTDTSDIDFTTGDTIVDTWAQFATGFTDAVAFIAVNSNGDAAGGLAIQWYGSSDEIYLWVGPGAGPGWVCNPGHNQGTGWVLEDDLWHHYTVHMDVSGNTIDLYRDGALIDSVTGSECGGDVDTLTTTVAAIVPDGQFQFGNGGAEGYLMDQYIVHQGITDGLTLLATIPEPAAEEEPTGAQLAATQIKNIMSGVGTGIGFLLEGIATPLGVLLIGLALVAGISGMLVSISLKAKKK